MTEPIVSLIVPAWRGGSPPPVAGLLDSVRANASTAVETIVVCNGQDPALVDHVSRGGATRVALLSQNAGVARGWNIGAHLALGRYLVFVNEDARIGSGCLEGLVAALEGDPTLGLVGPKGARWHVDAARARHTEYVFGPGLVPCDVVSGFLFAIPRRVLAEVGYFDDEYSPCSYEEIDIAQAVSRAGYAVAALGGLAYEHEWGVSAWDPDREVAWMAGAETTGAIALRNEAHFVRKWGGAWPARDGRRYDASYFERHGYVDAMTQPRPIRGRTEAPLAQTLADVVFATGLLPPGGSVLDVGCAHGFLVRELVARGCDAFGVDMSADAVAASTVRDRIWQGNALEMPTDRRFDLVFAGDIYEHLGEAEARILTLRIRCVTDVIVAIVNKSRHDPTHVTIQSNRAWLRLFADCGFGFEAGATWRGRARYLRDSAGTEDWHRNLLVVSRRNHARWRSLAVSAIGDGAGVWRVAGLLAPWKR